MEQMLDVTRVVTLDGAGRATLVKRGRLNASQRKGLAL